MTGRPSSWFSGLARNGHSWRIVSTQLSGSMQRSSGRKYILERTRFLRVWIIVAARELFCEILSLEDKRSRGCERPDARSTISASDLRAHAQSSSEFIAVPHILRWWASMIAWILGTPSPPHLLGREATASLVRQYPRLLWSPDHRKFRIAF